MLDIGTSPNYLWPYATIQPVAIGLNNLLYSEICGIPII